MATSINISTFPPNTTIFVSSLANAGLVQTVTITPPQGAAAVFQGSGENNSTMALKSTGFLTTGSGQARFTTGSSAGTYKVQIASSQGSENVQFAAASSSWSSGATANMLMVVGEDATDKDFNDAVALFMWYTPASS